MLTIIVVFIIAFAALVFLTGVFLALVWGIISFVGAALARIFNIQPRARHIYLTPGGPVEDLRS